MDLSKRSGAIHTELQLCKSAFDELVDRRLVIKDMDVSQRFIQHHPSGEDAGQSIIGHLVSNASIPEFSTASGDDNKTMINRFKEVLLSGSVTATKEVGGYKVDAVVASRVFITKIFEEELNRRMETMKEMACSSEDEDDDDDDEMEVELKLVVGVADSTNIEEAKKLYTWCARSLPKFTQVHTIQEGRASGWELANNADAKSVMDDYLAIMMEVTMMNLSAGSFSTQVQVMKVTKREARVGVDGGGGGGGKKKKGAKYVLTVLEADGVHGDAASSTLTQNILSAAQMHAEDQGLGQLFSKYLDKQKWEMAEIFKVKVTAWCSNIFYLLYFAQLTHFTYYLLRKCK